MTVKVVSDISQGYYEDGTQTDIYYCYRVIAAEKTRSYTGVLPYRCCTHTAEARALQIGVSTALSSYPDAKQIVCFTDNSSLLSGKKGNSAKTRTRMERTVNKRGKLILFRHYEEERAEYLNCHREAKALMRLRKKETPLPTIVDKGVIAERSSDKNPHIVNTNTVAFPPEKKSLSIIARIKKFLNIFRG